MEQDRIPVKPWAQAAIESSINARKAKIWYLMHLKGTSLKGLQTLLGGSPSIVFLSQVLSGVRKSQKLEERIAVILGVTWDEIFGTGAGKVRAA